jgi:RND family efflux transporter MFP subunit
VIATLENSSERASVLQAEGAYEAALALKEQNSVSVTEAQNQLLASKERAITDLRSAYNTTNSAVVIDIDQFFTNPNSGIPGLRIGGRGFTQTLNNERIAYQDLLPEWQARVNQLNANSDLYEEITYAQSNAQRTIDLVDIFLTIFDKRDDDEDRDAEIQFISLKNSLNQVLAELNQSRTNLKSAEDSLERSRLNASGGQVSSADAQIKQALGALQSAQANLAKTILRSPISGTVNSLSVRTGDFINSFAEVAVVANNSALEITTAVSDDELALLSIGDEVMIEGEYSGTVTQIAPAVNQSTGKTEVRIATEDASIANGDTVRITKDIIATEIESLTLQVPITAVRFDREDGFVFLIEDGELVSRPVTLGQILGNSVEIVSGLEPTEAFVIDARGLVAGESVEIQN